MIRIAESGATEEELQTVAEAAAVRSVSTANRSAGESE